MCFNPVSQDDITLLADDLHNACLSMRKSEYSKYMFMKINEFLDFDSAWLSVIEISETKVHFKENFLFKQPDKMIKDYEKYSGCDTLAMCSQIQEYPRKVIDFEDIQPYEEYRDSELFLNYGNHYEIHQALSIAAWLSKPANKCLILNIYSADPDRRFEKQELSFIENIFLFILPSWCGKLGFYNDSLLKSNISQKSLSKHIVKKWKFTKREEELINEILYGEGCATAEELAKRLKIGAHTVDIHLGNIYGKIGIKNDEVGINKKIKFIKFLENEENA